MPGKGSPKGKRNSKGRTGQAFAKFGPSKRAKYLKLLRKGNHRCTSARGVGVSIELVRLYRHQFPDFVGQEEAAESEACGLVEDALFEAAQLGNVVACQVWLYNREPERWKDKRAIEHTGRDGRPMQIEVVETLVTTRQEATTILDLLKREQNLQ
jgi:hypothetical protein